LLQNPANRASLRWGSGTGSVSLLHRLAVLPARYFADRRFAAALFPTLVIAVFEEPENLRVVAREVRTRGRTRGQWPASRGL
jgi:hypothetical protein